MSCTETFVEVQSYSVPSPELGILGHRKERETKACRRKWGERNR